MNSHLTHPGPEWEVVRKGVQRLEVEEGAIYFVEVGGGSGGICFAPTPETKRRENWQKPFDLAVELRRLVEELIRVGALLPAPAGEDVKVGAVNFSFAGTRARKKVEELIRELGGE